MADTPNKRILEIELMKAIAIIGMIFVHIYELTGFAFQAEEGPEYWLGITVEFMGGVISAGTFMFAMGWGIAFSDRATAKTYFDRFLQLNLLGLFVNIFSQWIPMLTAEKVSFTEGWYRIFAVDIYPFAALTMLYFALIKKLFHRKTYLLLVSAVLLAASLVTNTLIQPDRFSTGSNVADTLIGLFVRENEYSYFPFITWIAFPLMGFGVGSIYKKMNSRKNFTVLLLLSGTTALITAAAVMNRYNMANAAFHPYEVEDTEYYAMNSMSIICAYGVIALEFILSAGILKLTKGRLPDLIAAMSKNVMCIYVTQWIIIGSIASLLAGLMNAAVYVIISVVILAAAFGCSVILKQLIQKYRHKDSLDKYLLK